MANGHDELTRPLRLVELAASAAAAAAQESELERVIEVMLERSEALGAIAATVHLLDPAGELILVGHRGVPPSAVAQLARLSKEAAVLCARAVLSRQIQCAESQDRIAADLVLGREVMRQIGSRASVAVPLSTKGRLIGVLTFGLPESHAFGEDELSALQAVGDAFAAAIDSAQARGRDWRMLSRIQAVRTAALTISGSVCLREVLQHIVEEAQRIVDADYAALGIFGGAPAEGFDLWVFAGAAGRKVPAALTEPLEPQPLLLENDGLSARYATDLQLRCRAGRPAAWAKTFLGAPVALGGAPLGHLYLVDKRGAAAFGEEDARTLELFAQHAAIAVEHARNHDALVKAIEEKERSEAALKESEARFRRLAENAPDVIARIELLPKPHLSYVSPSARSLIGEDPEHLYEDASALSTRLHPADRPRVEETLRDPDRAPPALIARWRRTDGRWIWVEVRFVTLHDEAGRAVAVEAVARDITDFKRAEREIENLLGQVRAKHAWLEAVIEHSPVGIVLVEDARGSRIAANREALRLFGRVLDPSQGIAQLEPQMRTGRGQPVRPAESLLRRALSGETVAAEERICVGPQGREVPVLVSARPIRGPSGAVEGAVAVYRDVSTMKELDRLREEWTSIVAHDLRQPVNVISLQASALLRRSRDPDVKGRVEHILASARQLGRMTSDLLEFSRIEARQYALVYQPVDLSRLVREVLDRNLAPVPDRSARITVGTDVPEVRCDPGRIEQVLSNLISNAVKYGSSRSRIEVALLRRDGEIEVTVSNEGEGIPSEELPRLFRRFHRSERARQSRIGGLGLGLYITRGLVEAHGGRIWAESVPGGRTTFHFTLPIGESSPVQPSA